MKDKKNCSFYFTFFLRLFFILSSANLVLTSCYFYALIFYDSQCLVTAQYWFTLLVLLCVCHNSGLLEHFSTCPAHQTALLTKLFDPQQRTQKQEQRNAGNKASIQTHTVLFFSNSCMVDCTLIFHDFSFGGCDSPLVLIKKRERSVPLSSDPRQTLRPIRCPPKSLPLRLFGNMVFEVMIWGCKW